MAARSFCEAGDMARLQAFSAWIDERDHVSQTATQIFIACQLGDSDAACAIALGLRAQSMGTHDADIGWQGAEQS